jgi:hypothetical protein
MNDRGLFIPKNKDTYIEYLYCIDWTTFVVNEIIIPEDVIIQLNEFIDFVVITTKQKFSENLIRKFYNRIPMNNLLTYQQVPMDILTPIIDSKIPEFFENWYLVWRYQKIDIDFIKRFYQYVDWHAISQNKDALSIDLINEFYNNLIWHEITMHGINEAIVEHYIHKMNSFAWTNVACFSKLSNNFILKYENNLDTILIFTSQQISEELIEYFLEKLSNNNMIEHIWSKISLNQKLSFEFIKKYKDKLNLLYLIRNPYIKRKYLKLLY